MTRNVCCWVIGTASRVTDAHRILFEPGTGEARYGYAYSGLGLKTIYPAEAGVAIGAMGAVEAGTGAVAVAETK